MNHIKSLYNFSQNYSFSYRRLPRPVVLLGLVCGVVLLSSMTSSKEVMNPEIASTPDTNYPIPFELTVRGASAGIQTEYFEQTIVDAIVANQLFIGLQNGNGKDYLLNIRIIKVNAPSFSHKMTVDMNVIWDLSRAGDGVHILHEKVSTSYTGGVFEGGLIGANRVRAATEGAARENIRAGLEMIASLDFILKSSTTTKSNDITSVAKNTH